MRRVRKNACVSWRHASRRFLAPKHFPLVTMSFVWEAYMVFPLRETWDNLGKILFRGPHGMCSPLQLDEKWNLTPGGADCFPAKSPPSCVAGCCHHRSILERPTFRRRRSYARALWNFFSGPAFTAHVDIRQTHGNASPDYERPAGIESLSPFPAKRYLLDFLRRVNRFPEKLVKFPRDDRWDVWISDWNEFVQDLDVFGAWIVWLIC